MPRKRKTAALSKRAKPKLPESDEENRLSEEDRQDKLQIFLKEFDKKVEMEERRMRDNLKNLQGFVSNQFHLQINELPMDIRRMTFADYIACGGTVRDIRLRTIKDNNPTTASKVAERVSHMRNASKLTNFETIQEEPNSNTVGKMLTAKKIPATQRTRKGLKMAKESTLMPPPSTHRSVLKTPVMQSQGLSGWATPLVTPKFDPRLPITPSQLRDAHPGEMLMSLDGSPLNNPADGKDRTVKVKGRTLTLNIDLSDSGEIDPAALEDMSRSQINSLLHALRTVNQKK